MRDNAAAMAPIEDYAPDRRHADGGAGRPRRLDRLAVLAAVRLGACFAALLGDEENGRWTIAPAGAIARATRRYRDDTLVLETEFETADGAVRLIDFMPPRDEAPDVVRIVEGVRGRVRDAHGAA